MLESKNFIELYLKISKPSTEMKKIQTLSKMIAMYGRVKAFEDMS